jgi:hypothetical protein
MDREREALNELVKKKQGAGATKELEEKKIREIRAKYMEKIRSVRSKITIARKHV